MSQSVTVSSLSGYPLFCLPRIIRVDGTTTFIFYICAVFSLGIQMLDERLLPSVFMNNFFRPFLGAVARSLYALALGAPLCIPGAASGTTMNLGSADRSDLPQAFPPECEWASSPQLRNTIRVDRRPSPRIRRAWSWRFIEPKLLRMGFTTSESATR